MLIAALGIISPGCGSSFHFPETPQEKASAPNEQAIGQGLPGLQDSGDLEPEAKTVTATSRLAEPDYTASLYIPAPASPQDEIKELKWFLELQIDEMSYDAYMSVRVSLNGHDLRTGSGHSIYHVYSRGKTVIYGYLQDSANIFVEGGDNAYEVYLSILTGSARISRARVYHAWRQDIQVATQIFNHQSALEADLLDTTTVITATSEPATPDFSWQGSNCSTVAPDIFKIRQTVIGFMTTVDSLSGAGTELNYRLKFNGYPVATGSFTTAGDHRDAATMVPEEVETKWAGAEEANTAELYLWVEQGEVTISDLQMYYGVGSSAKSTDKIFDALVMEIHVSGVTSMVFQIKHRGEGVPEFRLAPTVWPYAPTFVQEGTVNGETTFSINQMVVGSDRGIYLRSNSADEGGVIMLKVVELDMITSR